MSTFTHTHTLFVSVLAGKAMLVLVRSQSQLSLNYHRMWHSVLSDHVPPDSSSLFSCLSYPSLHIRVSIHADERTLSLSFSSSMTASILACLAMTRTMLSTFVSPCLFIFSGYILPSYPQVYPLLSQECCHHHTYYGLTINITLSLSLSLPDRAIDWPYMSLMLLQAFFSFSHTLSILSNYLCLLRIRTSLFLSISIFFLKLSFVLSKSIKHLFCFSRTLFPFFSESLPSSYDPLPNRLARSVSVFSFYHQNDNITNFLISFLA